MAGIAVTRSTSLGRSCCSRALTLVETLVVIAILLALAAISMPVLNFVKSKAQAGSCASNLAQLHKASVMYADDHVGLLPCHPLQTHYWELKPGEGGGTSAPPPEEYRDDYPPPYDNLKCFIAGRPQLWRDSLKMYTRSDEVFWCAADRFRADPSFLADMDDPKDHRSLYTSYELDFRLQRCMYEGEGHTLRHRLRSLAPDTPYLEDALWLDYAAGAATRSVHGVRRSNVLYVGGHVKFVSW